jgi:hypothetical protein
MKGKTTIPAMSHQQVRDAIDYNPVTGMFVWKVSPAKNIKAGSFAGGQSKGAGYKYIRFNGEEVTQPRFAWFYMTGEWPDRRVRFKNGDKNDCRFENLTLFNGIGGEYDHKTREGRLAYSRVYRAKTPSQQKARALRNSFDLSLSEYQRMHEEQNGKCAICNQPETQMRLGKLKMLSVDHNHTTGKVRSLLCSDCNIAIGKAKEDRNILLSAIQYLDKHSEASPNVVSLDLKG